jgi:hypothetical protein
VASSPLDELAAACGREFPHLTGARRRTGERLAARRKTISDIAADADVSVVLMGSWGRAEVTSGSDDDYMLLVNGAWRPNHEIDPSIEDVATALDCRPPGREGLFGEVVFCDFLEKRIGLQEDDNNNMSRRMLLLLESEPVLGENVHAVAWEKILAGYLVDAEKPQSPPRLLLNDIVRYWRTICVDFAGKQRKRRGEGWGIRNAKLRTSRKMLFAGGLIPVLQCGQLDLPDMAAFLRSRLRMPPTDRVAQAFLEADTTEAGGRALGAYDEFLGLLNDEAFRNALEALTRQEADRSAEFAEVRRLGEELQQGLLALLFDTALLPPFVREYAIF